MFNPSDVAKQLRTPQGAWGHVIGKVMNVGNASMHGRMQALMEVGLDHEVLEVGFGGGTMLDQFLAMTPRGRVVGVDVSETMIERARRKHANLIISGRLTVVQASVEEMPLDTERFDWVASANTLYFWPDPEAAARELIRVLRPGGALVLGFANEQTLRSYPVYEHGFRAFSNEEVEGLLEDAGFAQIALRPYSQGSRGFVIAKAHRPG